MRPRLRFGLKLLGPLDAAVEDEDVESGQDEGNDKAGMKTAPFAGSGTPPDSKKMPRASDTPQTAQEPVTLAAEEMAPAVGRDPDR